MKEFDIFALAIIYPSLPENIKEKVLFSILSKTGLSISLEDLKSEMPSRNVASSIAVPVYKPSIYCNFCREKLHELNEGEKATPQMEAKYLDKHLDKCPIFQVMEKHRKS